jgi:hypothetical protein
MRLAGIAQPIEDAHLFGSEIALGLLDGPLSQA